MGLEGNPDRDNSVNDQFIPNELLNDQAAFFAWFESKLPLSKGNFKEVIRMYNLLASEQEQRKFLLNINGHPVPKSGRDNRWIKWRKGKPTTYNDLAESIMLFADQISGNNDHGINSAHQHYLINTDGPIPQDGDSDSGVFKWAEEYASRFSIQLIGPDAATGNKGETLMIMDKPEKPIVCKEWGDQDEIGFSRSLRDVGGIINDCRYGGKNIVPSSLFSFEPKAADFSKANAIRMADISSLVYRREAYVKNQLIKWGYTSPQWIADNDTDTQCVIASSPDHSIIAFRGSQEKIDFLTDAKISKDIFNLEIEALDSGDEKLVISSPGLVHHGFYSALEAVAGDLLPAIRKLPADRPLFITGHSLGGALAQLAALLIHRFDPQIISWTYSFGSPRIGDEKFKASFPEVLKKRNIRFVNNRDIVPTSPFGWLGFRHVTDQRKKFKDTHEMDDNAEVEETLGYEQSEDSVEYQRQKVIDSINNSNAYLKITNLNKQDSQESREEVLLTYGRKSKKGSFDDHGISEYLFKIACSLIEDKMNEVNS